MKGKLLLDAGAIASIIAKASNEIYNDIKDVSNFAIVGVQTRGVELANRIKRGLERMSGVEIKSGILDITFYRDDLATRKNLPLIKETRIDFDISGMKILLVDDVLFTGRTVKAALETLTSFGRPSMIKLFVLVDRGNRELPIQPDYYGHRLATDLADDIKVSLRGIDEAEDSVYHITEI